MTESMRRAGAFTHAARARTFDSLRRGPTRADARAVFWALFCVVPLTAYACRLAHLDAVAGVLMNCTVEAGLVAGIWRLCTPAFAARLAAEAPAAVPAARLWREIGVVAASFVVVTLLGYGGYIATTGVPAFRQDWAWPADDDAMHRLWSFLTSDWTPEAFGHPKPYPTLYAMFAPIALAGNVLHSRDVLSLFFGACELGAGVGIFLLARVVLGTRPLPALAGAIFYACGPYVVDKVVGGHIHVVLAYAVLPWCALVVVFADRSSRALLPLWIALEAALVAFAMSALTFVAFFFVALLALARVVRFPRRALALVLLANAAAMLCHIQSLQHLFTFTGLDSGRSALGWLKYLSTDSASVLGAYEYLAGYARTAFPGWAGAPVRELLLPLTAFGLGWAVAYGPLRTVAFALVALFGVVWTTGVDGPFAAFKGFLYAHVHALAAFREFYNVQILVAFGVAAVLATAFDAVLRSRRATRIAGAAAVAVAVAVAVIPYFDGGIVSQLRLFHETAPYRAFAKHLTANEGERIAMFPLVQPMRTGNDDFAGVDSYTTGFYGHPTLAEWLSEPSVAVSALMYHDGDLARANRLTGLLGVRWLVLRKGLVSAYPSYWFPNVFPDDWETNAYYKRIAADSSLRRVSDTFDFTLLENPDAMPIVSLAPPTAACAGVPLLVDADGACRTLAPDDALIDVPRVQRLHLPPQPTTIDPANAWTPPYAIFGLGWAYAAEGAGVATMGGTPYRIAFVAERAGKLSLRCVSRNGVHAFLDGANVGTLCRGRSEALGWFGGIPLAAGAHALVLLNGGGPTLVTDAIVDDGARPDTLARLSAFPWTRPYAAPYQHAHVRFARTAAGALDGVFDADEPGTLLFSDAFDAHWRLVLDGRPAGAAERVNGVENGFAVPPGRHRFSLRFEPPAFDRILGLVQGAMWPLFVLVALVSLGRAIRTRHAS